MVEATVANIVAGSVTTDDPLAAFGQEMFEFLNLFAGWATSVSALFYERSKFLSCNAAFCCIIFAVNPFLSGTLVVCGHFGIGNHFFEQGLDAFAHLLVGRNHTHTEFAEIFKQTVGPCRTLAFGVGRVGCSGNGARVDGRTSSGICYHLTVTEELADEFHIRSFTAARACTAEFKERLSKL